MVPRRVKAIVWARRGHRWLGWLIGMQVLLWLAGGVYMSTVPLNWVHGDHLVKKPEQPPLLAGGHLGTASLLRLYPGVQSFRLGSLAGRDVFELHGPQGIALADARSGELLSPLQPGSIEALARETYQGEGQICSLRWLVEPPPERATLPAPLWAVRFDDRAETTLYFSPATGALLARTHRLWRWFDTMWMLHIMDYSQRSNPNNGLMRMAVVAGLVFALSGAWLAWFSLRRAEAAVR